MIEVLFTESAGVSLKMAQHCGDEKFYSGACCVTISSADGSKATEEEIQIAQREIEEKERHEWENTTPMGGNPADVYGFNFVLSIGDISENVPGEKRQQVLEWLYGIYPECKEESSFTAELMQREMDILKEVRSRITAGESVRIWYSNQPDELCGMYWFMDQLNQLELQSDQVILVPLPDREVDEGEEVVIGSGWDSLKPREWHPHLDLQRVATSAFCKECAAHWKRLQQENAPLRAMLNGRLVSAPETLYDEFIIHEIEAEEDEFNEAMLIGRFLLKYQIGISDAWIAQRIESMISAGKLVPVTEPAQDCPIYHRKLKKQVEMKGK